MKILTAALFALALSATGASAQQFQPQFQPPPTSAFGPDPVMRITVSFRTAVEAVDARAVPDQKAQETARRALYHMAADECAALSETFQAECRLGSLQIFTQVTPVQPPNAPARRPLDERDGGLRVEAEDRPVSARAGYGFA